MITLLNKLLARFGFQLVSTKPDITLVEATVKFMNENSKSFSGSDDYLYAMTSGYVGDINYLEDKNGTTYYQDLRSKTYYCDYDVKNPSKEILGLMIDETTFTPEELEENLKNG